MELTHLRTHMYIPGDNLRGSRCGRDYHLNSRGRCVPDSTTTTVRCGRNERLARNGRHCVKIETSTRCDPDYHYSTRKERCVANNTSNGTSRCGRGYRLNRRGRCVADSADGSPALRCDRGYHYSNRKDRCVADIGTGRDKENAAQKRQRQRDKRRVRMGRNR